MSNYNIESKNSLRTNISNLNDEAIECLWGLFKSISKYWEFDGEIETLKSNFLIFISNRIEIDLNYISYYLNANDVINELKKEYGKEEAYKFLMTNSYINISLPTTPISQTRQFVSNEFIGLYLSLGGFKSFGSIINYPGYFGGANTEEFTPYRKYKM